MNLSIGFIPIARSTFDIPFAEEKTAQVVELLQSNFTVVGSSELVTTAKQIGTALQPIIENMPDLLLIFQASFADSTMVVEIAKKVTTPLLLWAVPEEHTGGRLRLNSLCGVNLAGHGLTRAGIAYEYIYADPTDETAVDKVIPLVQAGKAKRILQQTRVGRVGENPDGFDTCLFDAVELQDRFGVQVVQLELQEDIFAKARMVEVEMVQTIGQKMAQQVAGIDLDHSATQGTLSAYATLQAIGEQQQLNGFSVRCWPEFFTEMGCAACGALSMLSNEMIPCSCEADVNGTITQIILQAISGEPAFGTDLVSIDAEQDAIVVWHCGLAPLSMADSESTPNATIHSNRKLPLLMEFPLKPGDITIARLSEANGEYRLVIGQGEMLRSPKSFSGTSGLLRFQRSAHEVFDTIMAEGLEHHISITYGNHVPALEALARMLKIPMLHL